MKSKYSMGDVVYTLDSFNTLQIRKYYIVGIGLNISGEVTYELSKTKSLQKGHSIHTTENAIATTKKEAVKDLRPLIKNMISYRENQIKKLRNLLRGKNWNEN